MRCVLSLAVGIVIAIGDTAQPREQGESPMTLSLRRMVTTVNAGDAAGYARLYSTDATITIFGGASIKGRSEIESYEVSLLREFPGTRLAFYEVWQAPPHAIVHYGVNGQTTAGRSMGHEGLLCFRFDASGAIAEERRYLDSLTPMGQLGALGPGPVRSLPSLPTDAAAMPTRHSATENANVALVRELFADVESKRAAAFLARTDTAISIDELMLPEPLRGGKAAADWFTMWNAIDGLRIEVTRTVGVGDDVLVETITRGTMSTPIGRLKATAKPFAVHRALVVHVAHGKIARILSVINGRELAESSGQWPLR